MNRLLGGLAMCVLSTCGGSSRRNDAQTDGDGPTAPPGSGGAIAGTGGATAGSGGTVTGAGGGATGLGGIIPGSGGATSGTGGGVSSVGGASAGGGGSEAADAALGSGGAPAVDGGGGTAAGGASGQGGVSGAGGSVATCGQPGFPCCSGNACAGGGCCVAGICMAAGGTCIGLGGGICSAGVCGACGGLGLPCCADDTGASSSCTAPSTRCSGGTCAKCGELGSVCCAGATAGATGICTSPNALCSNDLCVPCGAPGTACCPGSACANPGCCYNDICVGENTACGTGAGTCVAGRCSGCGGANQPCCPNAATACYDGLLCQNDTCTQCGDSGQMCCPASSVADQCKTGLACTSTGADGLCARCGGLGDICCAGNACNEGCCAGGRCITGSCSEDAGTATDAPVSQCASGGVPCSGLAHFTGVQVLDGRDDEFCNVPAFELGFANAGKTIEWNTTGKTYPELAVARVAWDSAGLHAFIRVTDTSFTPAGSTQSWNGDGIELMFSSSTAVTGLTYNDTNTLHVIISPPTVQYSLDSTSSGTQYSLPTSEYVVGSDGTGYFAELDLPWPGTAAVPGASSQIKFDMQVNIADGTTSTSDLYVRDAQAILYMGTSSTCTQPYCDDRAWCTTTLLP
jgi:hypothetical protein